MFASTAAPAASQNNSLGIDIFTGAAGSSDGSVAGNWSNGAPTAASTVVVPNSVSAVSLPSAPNVNNLFFGGNLPQSVGVDGLTANNIFNGANSTLTFLSDDAAAKQTSAVAEASSKGTPGATSMIGNMVGGSNNIVNVQAQVEVHNTLNENFNIAPGGLLEIDGLALATNISLGTTADTRPAPAQVASKTALAINPLPAAATPTLVLHSNLLTPWQAITVNSASIIDLVGVRTFASAILENNTPASSTGYVQGTLDLVDSKGRVVMEIHDFRGNASSIPNTTVNGTHITLAHALQSA